MKFHRLTLAVQSLFQNMVLREAKRYDILPGQPRILDFLSENDGASLSEISRGCYLKNPTVTGLIDRMEKSELVRRQMLKGNKKTTYICLTPKGKTSLESICKIFETVENRALKGLSIEEKEVFLSTLEKIKNNLEENSNER